MVVFFQRLIVVGTVPAENINYKSFTHSHSQKKQFLYLQLFKRVFNIKKIFENRKIEISDTFSARHISVFRNLKFKVYITNQENGKTKNFPTKSDRRRPKPPKKPLRIGSCKSSKY